MYYLLLLLQVYSSLERDKSHIVNTSWAMLSLMAAGQVIYLFMSVILSFRLAESNGISLIFFDFISWGYGRFVCFFSSLSYVTPL
jgi:hypothetical protein